MSLKFGRELLAIPGPSIMPDRVLNAMHRPSPNIYEGELVDLTNTLFPDLKRVARTAGRVAIYIANGHGAWEAALRNVVKERDRILVLSTGRFGAGWGEMASDYGVEVDLIDFGMASPADPQRVLEHLKADTKGEIKAVLTVQADTASSVINDIPAIRAAMDEAGHDALLMVDCIASLGCDRFEMDEWGVDVMITGCQKGLMTPAGLSFVFFNDKARDTRKGLKPGRYWDWDPRTDGEIFYQFFCGTAPTHHIYGLREALTMLLEEEGIENVWQRHETMAAAVWAAIDVWSEEGALTHNIDNRAHRTVAVSTLNTADGLGTRIRNWCEHEAGVTLGIGLGFGLPGSVEWDRHFRIGHMGHLNVPMIMGALGAVDTALKALEISHGEGALSAAARTLAAHQ